MAEPTWIVLSGVGVRCNHCGTHLEYPESGNQKEWHDLLEEFIEKHKECKCKK
jgi:hypothetical protein